MDCDRFPRSGRLPATGLIACLAALGLAAVLPPAGAQAAQAPRPTPRLLLDGPAPAGAAGTEGGAAGATVRARACASGEVTPAESGRVRTAIRRWTDERLDRPAEGTIRVVVHVITARGEGDVSDERLHDQIRELNRRFAGSGFRFELAGVDRTEQSDWFRMTPGSDAERRAKASLALDPARLLNVYLCDPGPAAGGWASFPWSAPEGDAQHGVVIHHASLAGGVAGMDPGGTLAHEVAHYLGLEGCELALTPGLVDRMRAVVPLYRPSLFGAAPVPDRAPSELLAGEGAEPEDGRVLAYRGAIPNPFRGETALRFTLPASQRVSLRVYSVTGQLVRTLVDATLPPGDHSAMFRAEDLPSGAYFAVLQAGAVRMTRTLMLVR